MPAGRELPPFLLGDAAGNSLSFPSGKPAIVCFVKDDCPTCHETMPVLKALHAAFCAEVDFFVAGQTAEGNANLAASYEPGFALLDDSTLKVSFAYDIDTVPSLFLTDADGVEQLALVGFVREEWQALAERVAEETRQAGPELDWSALPEWRPGCGSLSVDPVIADRLRART